MHTWDHVLQQRGTPNASSSARTTGGHLKHKTKRLQSGTATVDSSPDRGCSCWRKLYLPPSNQWFPRFDPGEGCVHGESSPTMPSPPARCSRNRVRAGDEAHKRPCPFSPLDATRLASNWGQTGQNPPTPSPGSGARGSRPCPSPQAPTFHRLGEDELQLALGLVLGVLHQAVHAVAAGVQARLLPHLAQRDLPPPLHHHRALGARHRGQRGAGGLPPPPCQGRPQEAPPPGGEGPLTPRPREGHHPQEDHNPPGWGRRRATPGPAGAAPHPTPAPAATWRSVRMRRRAAEGPGARDGGQQRAQLGAARGAPDPPRPQQAFLGAPPRREREGLARAPSILPRCGRNPLLLVCPCGAARSSSWPPPAGS